ncbi:MAG: hypothetical protein LBB94_11745 [Clostridiales bacterium]|jgi:hypothetical protein|nr:hypothetical protein [Clostridiales bacterium]
MKKKFSIVHLVIIALYFMSSCQISNHQTKVFTFSGKNSSISINNGVIIIDEDIEKFIGGNLTLINIDLKNIKYYSTEFYYYKDNLKIILHSDIVSTNATVDGLNVSTELGYGSSEKLYISENINIIKNSLNFSLSGAFINGESFEYNIVLDVKEVL